MAGIIEEDEIMSKGNYGSRKGYLIDDLTLENKLLHDWSMHNVQPTIHNFTDLESCYDRKLANACGVVEEVAGVDRWGIKLFTKVMPQVEHSIRITCGTSD